MQTPASIAGHPIHPMLITIPVGLFVFSLACDLISLLVNNPSRWEIVAFYSMVGGLVGALAAAIPGSIDLFSLTIPKLRKIGLWHMGLNLVALTLYAVNIWLRIDYGTVRGTPLALSVVSIGILSVSAWLGAELVHRHGVGVDVVADPLKHPPAAAP